MKSSENVIKVGGLPITPFLNMEDAVDAICLKDSILPGFAIAINAEKVILARSNSEIRDSLKTGTLLYADGISVVKTIKKKGRANIRIPGCELWEELMKRAAKTNKHVYLLGANEQTNKEVAIKLQKLYGLSSLTRHNGYFEQQDKIIEQIVTLKPDIVTVALGSPKQEELIKQLRKVHPRAFYMGVGGTYDVFVGNVKRAPKLFQRLHLEWFYRALLQPKRIFRQTSLAKYLILHLGNRL